MRTLEALNSNRSISYATLYVFSDGPKTFDDKARVAEVRQLIRRSNNFTATEISESPVNKGLATSVIDGVTQVIAKHGQIVVLEDDVVTSPGWYEFMNGAVNFYKDNPNIWSVGGYCPPINLPESYPYDVFLSPMETSYSWGTWMDRWNLIDWEITDFNEFIKDRERVERFCGWKPSRMRLLKRTMRNKNNSWAVRFGYASAKHSMLSVLPTNSRVTNIGYDKGEHSCSRLEASASAKYSAELDDQPCEFKNDMQLSSKIVTALRDFHHSSTYARVKHFCSRLVVR